MKSMTAMEKMGCSCHGVKFSALWPKNLFLIYLLWGALHTLNLFGQFAFLLMSVNARVGTLYTLTTNKTMLGTCVLLWTCKMWSLKCGNSSGCYVGAKASVVEPRVVIMAIRQWEAFMPIVMAITGNSLLGCEETLDAVVIFLTQGFSTCGLQSSKNT